MFTELFLLHLEMIQAVARRKATEAKAASRFVPLAVAR